MDRGIRRQPVRRDVRVRGHERIRDEDPEQDRAGQLCARAALESALL